MDFPSRVLDSVGDLRAVAQEQAKALKAEADEAARIERVWDDLFRFVSRGWLFHVVNLLEKSRLY
jgi:hypothetical protein